MPPSRDMGSEGGSQTELFQWGATSMVDWRRDGYNTTNDNYNGGYSMNRKSHHSMREETPWSTTNDTYGKGVVRTRSEQGGAASLQGSMLSYRSHPGFKREALSLTTDRPSPRDALEERLRQRAAAVGAGPSPLATPNGSLRGPPSGSQWSLPPLDPSKYLIAQTPIAPNWQRAKPEAETTLHRSGGGGDPDPISRQAPPPKTGPAKRYMRDTLDRFLRSIPEELRPRTRKRSMQPREAPQVLKIEHRSRPDKTPALRERDTRTSMSHAIPSPPTSASSRTSSSPSSAGSDDGVVDLNQSAYSLRKELEKDEGKQTNHTK